MIEFDFKTIPLVQQRYSTLGDYYRITPTRWAFRVARFKDDRYALLVFIHEFVEFLLTQEHGITEEEITKFDKDHLDVDEPGALSGAPYHKEHMIAEAIERIVAGYLGIDWNDYEKACNEVFYEVTAKTE